MRFDRRGTIAAAALALLLGAALRIAFVRHAAPLTGDALIYGQIAANWLRSNVYGYAPGGGQPHLTLIRLPGYPLFLLLCFRLFGVGNYIAVMAVQSVVDLASCLLVGLTAGRLFGPRAGLFALTLAALCPFTSNYVAAPLTETLTLFCIALAIYALVRWIAAPGLTRWLFVLAVALAYALLLRPEQALLTAAVLPVLWRQSGAPGWRPGPDLRPKALPTAAVLLCVLLPLVPWTIRNWRAFHVFEPLAPHYATDPGEYVPLGFQRWYRSWAVDFASTEDVYWNFDGAQIKMGDLPNRAFDSAAQRAHTAAVLDDYNETTDSNPTIDARFEELARERIARSSFRYYVELPFVRLADMLLRPRTELMQTTLDWWNRREYRRDFRFALSYAALNLLYLLLGLAGLARWRRLTRGSRIPASPVLLATAVFVLLRCALLLTLDNSEPRYTLEFFPILCLWAGALAATRLTADQTSSSYPS